MTAPENLSALAEQIAAQAMAYPYKVWGFGEGIALHALWSAADALKRPDYRDWVLALLERWLQREPPIQEADHSAPGFSLLDAYELTGNSRYLERALLLADYLQTLPRSTSGATLHRPTHTDYHHFLYVDCMEVDAPFFCRLARVTGNARCNDMAVEQILGYCVLLQDPVTGLFYHQYNQQTQRTNGAFWGRGNGWALLGLVETLALLPQTHPGWNLLAARLTSLADALAARQITDGNWPTVLDRPAAYTEGSLPAMFGYGFSRAITLGLLPSRFQASAESAWDAMLKRLTPDGVLQGVSVATPPGNGAHYESIRTGGVFPWGQGPALLTCLTRLADRSEP